MISESPNDYSPPKKPLGEWTPKERDSFLDWINEQTNGEDNQKRHYLLNSIRGMQRSIYAEWILDQMQREKISR